MSDYLVSNIAGRNYRKIYGHIEKNAVFDLDPTQHGWKDFSNIAVGDRVYVIGERRNVTVCCEMTKIFLHVRLENDETWGKKVVDTENGNTKVIFGDVLFRVDKEYSQFVRENKIINSKLDPKTGMMRQGFNCAAWLE